MAPSKFELPSLSPINISLTEGTDIPPPLESPVRPPTPGGGPLSSHPTTPKDAAGFPRTPTPNGVAKSSSPAERATTPTVNVHDFLTATSPPGAHRTPKSTRDSKDRSRPSSSGRRFLGFKPPKSLRSLSSSLAPGRESTENLQSPRPGSPFTTASSTYTTITANSEMPASPPLSRKKSASWFGKRKSAMFFVGKIDEADWPSEAEHKSNAALAPPPPEKKGPPPPTLPALKSLGSDLDGGSLTDLHSALSHIS